MDNFDVIRIVGNNLAGGARRYCYMLNHYLKDNFDINVLTFIPKAPIEDPLSDADKTGLPYINTRNWLIVAWHILKNKNNLNYVHLHLRNVAILFGFFCKFISVPYVVTVHAPNQVSDSLRQRVLSSLYRFVLLRAARVVFISKFVRTQVLAGLGLNEGRLKDTVIHNGSADPGVVRLFNPALNQISVCIVGEITLRKGIMRYVELISALVKAQPQGRFIFNFYGKGPLEVEITRLKNIFADKFAIIEINLMGYKVDLDEIYLRNDIHIILAEKEAFGRVVTEAMAYGVPTIAINDGAFSEIISDGKDGWIVSAADDAVEILLNCMRDPEYLLQTAVLARNKFETHFSHDISISKTISFIDVANLEK